MKIATIVARVLLGLVFFVFGLNGFLNFISLTTPRQRIDFHLQVKIGVYTFVYHPPIIKSPTVSIPFISVKITNDIGITKSIFYPCKQSLGSCGNPALQHNTNKKKKTDFHHSYFATNLCSGISINSDNSQYMA